MTDSEPATLNTLNRHGPRWQWKIQSSLSFAPVVLKGLGHTAQPLEGARPSSREAREAFSRGAKAVVNVRRQKETKPSTFPKGSALI